MVAREPHTGERKLVLAFDVGTTYSGISYSILQPGQIPELRGVTRFPGQGRGSGNAKVPSILYYDKSGHVRAVGSEVLAEEVIEKAEEEGWVKAEWWKLHLRPKHLASTHIRDDQIYPLPPGKSAVEVLTDFIKYLFDCTKTYIQEHHIGFNWQSIEDSIEYIFTYPNGWEGLQQQQYRKAVERAGLIPSTRGGQARVRLLTEGEASLHYCISCLPDQPANTETEGLVIIDAGGGTIDLSMYSVTFSPVSCEEIAPAECHLQGSVFVTQRAKDLLKRRLRGSRSCDDEQMDVIIRDFDQNTKTRISDATKEVYVRIGDRFYNDEQYKISRGSLKLSGLEATGLFEESIKAIIDGFVQQCKFIKSKITMAFLVGGMGTNEYVWTRLQSHFRAQGINMSRPDNDINKSVANGAVLFYICGAVKTRVSRITYGFRCSPRVDEANPEHQRRKLHWKRDASGRFRVRYGFKPILCKGDRINENKETRHGLSFCMSNQGDFSDVGVELFSYRGTSTHPQWIDEEPSFFTRICEIRANINEAAQNAAPKIGVSGNVYYKVPLEVVAFFGAAEWTAQMTWQINGNEQCTPATIIYYD